MSTKEFINAEQITDVFLKDSVKSKYFTYQPFRPKKWYRKEKKEGWTDTLDSFYTKEDLEKGKNGYDPMLIIDNIPHCKPYVKILLSDGIKHTLYFNTFGEAEAFYLAIRDKVKTVIDL